MESNGFLLPYEWFGWMNGLISKDTQFRISAGKNVIFKRDLPNICSFLTVSHRNFLLLITLVMASWWHQKLNVSLAYVSTFFIYREK